MKKGCIINGLVLFFLAMSSLAILGGIYLVTKTYDLKFNGIKTTAILVNYDISETKQTERDQPRYGQTDYYFQPIFRFLVNGDSLTAATHSSSKEMHLAPGDAAEIFYSPSDPTFIEQVENINSMLVAGFVCLLLGVAVLIITILLVKHFRKTATPV